MNSQKKKKLHWYLNVGTRLKNLDVWSEIINMPHLNMIRYTHHFCGTLWIIDLVFITSSGAMVFFLTNYENEIHKGWEQRWMLSWLLVYYTALYVSNMADDIIKHFGPVKSFSLLKMDIFSTKNHILSPTWVSWAIINIKRQANR